MCPHLLPLLSQPQFCALVLLAQGRVQAGGQELCWFSWAFLAILASPWPSPQIITSEEAERRGQIYDRQGATYLFDLDYVEDVYTVDAAYYGNISHFVNHSVGTPQAGGGREEQAGAPPHPPAVLFRLV